MSDPFYDAVYEAWRSGYNPDAVNPDRIDDDQAQGYDHDLCVERELQRIRPRCPVEEADDAHE